MNPPLIMPLSVRRRIDLYRETLRSKIQTTDAPDGQDDFSSLHNQPKNIFETALCYVRGGIGFSRPSPLQPRLRDVSIACSIFLHPRSIFC